jgi:hypothetical protein
MKKLVLCVLPLVAVAGCRSAGPRLTAAAPAAPNALAAYVDELRLLRHDAAKPRIRIAEREHPSGAQAVAVRVRAAAFARDGARFSLETIGVPKLHDRRAQWRRVQPELELVVSGLSAGSDPARVTARVDELLETPEAYLAANGIRFDRPAGEVPAEVASREVAATSAEHSLGRQLTAWPLPLLSVDPWYHDRSRRVKHEGEIEMEAVVGTDGRLHRPRVRTSLSELHQGAVLRALPLWRFEPARRAEVPVPAAVALRPVLHID